MTRIQPVDKHPFDLSIDLSTPPVGNPPTGQNRRSDHVSAPDMSETLRQVQNRRSEGYSHLSETLPPTGVAAGAPAHPPRRAIGATKSDRTAEACRRLFDLMALEPEHRRHTTHDSHERMTATYAAMFGAQPEDYR